MLRSVLVVLSLLAVTSFGYFVTIDANGVECFFDRAKAGERLTLFFEVSEGGFYDINVKVIQFFLFLYHYSQLTAPDGSVLYKIEKESSGHYSFTATSNGKYIYCFDNTMSTVTPKTVLFALEKGTSMIEKEKGNAPDQNKLIDMVNELSNAVLNAKHEMEYLEVRENIHRASKLLHLH